MLTLPFEAELEQWDAYGEALTARHLAALDALNEAEEDAMEVYVTLPRCVLTLPRYMLTLTQDERRSSHVRPCVLAVGRSGTLAPLNPPAAPVLLPTRMSPPGPLSLCIHASPQRGWVRSESTPPSLRNCSCWSLGGLRGCSARRQRERGAVGAAWVACEWPAVSRFAPRTARG
jgi:hypothetical protein